MTTELVVVSGPDVGGLVAAIDRLVGFIDRVPDSRLVDLAFTAAQTTGDERLALVVGSTAELRSRLASARARLAGGGVTRLRDKSGTYYFRDHLLGDGRGKLAFVYPGVFSFYPDMMRDLAILDPSVRSAFDELEEALKGDASFSPSDFIFPPAPCYRHDADIFSSGAYAQAMVATYAGCVAMTRMVRAHGLEPAGVVGFAGGDLAAMMRSGAAGDAPARPERVKLIRDIYRIVDTAVDHAGLPETAMITVLLRRSEDAEAVLSPLLATFPAGKVELALDLSPRQKTYAVAPDFEQEALKEFLRAGVRAMKLALNRPFNTSQCESLVPEITKFVTKWMKCDPRLEVYSCSSAAPVPATLRHARKDTAGRWSKPVLFADTVRRMYDDGYRVFLEVGPRGLMTTSVEDTLKGREHAAIAMNSIHRRGELQAQHAIAQLLALGARMDVTWVYRRRGARLLDFDSSMPADIRRESEMPLSRKFPWLKLLSADSPLGDVGALVQQKGRGARAATRAAAVAARNRRQRQFDFGAMNPMVSDADVLEQTPGITVELTKTFRLSDAPFIGDFAIGTSQLSYDDPNLRGLVLLTIPVAAEIMAETAGMLTPGMVLVAIDDLQYLANTAFVNGALRLFVRAERVACADPERVAVKVLVRDDRPNSAYTKPIAVGMFTMAREYAGARPVGVDGLTNPRSVHWSGRDVYPVRLCVGRRLRGISFVETWSESGIDYEVTVPSVTDSVLFTRFPVWSLNPLFLGAVVGGFGLWRSHERFRGAHSFPSRLRHLEILSPLPAENARTKCYMRLTGVTPKSHLCDITVSDGDGVEIMSVQGWEETVGRVNVEYRDLIMQPATSFITRPLPDGFVGMSGVPCSSAFAADIPYGTFERDDELLLKIFSHIVLSSAERREFMTKTGSASRRTEWLFGRIAAKEAVRRFLKERYQARWSYADVSIYPDSRGKPNALGGWNDSLRLDLDIAIAHTSEFVVALAALNHRVGVDVESTARNLSAEFAEGVFSPEELELAAQAVNAAQTLVRFWCAKESVSKALGCGIVHNPREMNVTSYDADSGRLTVRLGGEWLGEFRDFRGRDIPVTVRSLHDHALAFCFIPSSLLPRPQ